MEKLYEEPMLEWRILNGNDVLTQSSDQIFEGDGWAEDPFTED